MIRQPQRGDSRRRVFPETEMLSEFEKEARLAAHTVSEWKTA